MANTFTANDNQPVPMTKLQKISEAKIQEISSTVKSQVVAEVVAQIQNMLGQLMSTTLETAVTGESGSGKSSFINTTGEAKVYAHPSVLTVQLWDLPGIGTPSFQPQDDLDAVGLYQYDFIIVTSEQFKECCVILPKCVEQVGKNFYFVCKKVDNNIKATKVQRTNYEAGLRQCGVDHPRVFLISWFKSQCFDFPQLQKILVRDWCATQPHLHCEGQKVGTVWEKNAFADCQGFTGAGILENWIPVQGTIASGQVFIASYLQFAFNDLRGDLMLRG
uniref:IRG-type G domain-containing protein n=1 Tax=Scleropages formosus TaxID=113540 RepID=A0A8C9VNF1_SCLFO